MSHYGFWAHKSIAIEETMTRYQSIRLFAILTAVLLALPARAQTPAEFYKGKTIRMLIPAAVGDSYDTEGRLIARFLANFIPGNPTIVAETCRAPRDATWRATCITWRRRTAP
jgi:hypothetical protein